jgi:hypothetical protein
VLYHLPFPSKVPWCSSSQRASLLCSQHKYSTSLYSRMVLSNIRSVIHPSPHPPYIVTVITSMRMNSSAVSPSWDYKRFYYSSLSFLSIFLHSTHLSLVPNGPISAALSALRLVAQDGSLQLSYLLKERNYRDIDNLLARYNLDTTPPSCSTSSPIRYPLLSLPPAQPL